MVDLESVDQRRPSALLLLAMLRLRRRHAVRTGRANK